MRLPLSCLLASLLAASAAHALPQYALDSAAACDTCHVRPGGWENPELRLRKCSLNCNECHVNPTGGGLRNEAGLFYGRQVLPLFGSRPYHPQELFDARHRTPTTRPAAGKDEVTGPDEPVTAAPSGDQGLSNPMQRISDESVRPPGSEGRYAGIGPSPTFQVGVDLRSMGYWPQLEGDQSAWFPMQTDLHLAVRPYDPDGVNRGRLTLLATGGALGSRFKEYDDIGERLFVKEFFALYDDLPYQAYVKAGRFLPAFGWRLDDHTAFVRQEQTFDHERQVTGVEVGLNPNYPYAHLSVYANERSEVDDPEVPTNVFVSSSGWGTALSAGYRHLTWQLGGSLMYEDRDEASDVWAGLNWGLNLYRARHPWKGLNFAPVVYLGELDYRRKKVDMTGEAFDGWTMFHQVDWTILRGVKLMARFDWQNRGLNFAEFDFVYGRRQRYTLGLVVHPYTYTQLLAQYRVNSEEEDLDNDETLLQLRAWY